MPAPRALMVLLEQFSRSEVVRVRLNVSDDDIIAQQHAPMLFL